MNLSGFAVNRPIAVFMLFIGIVIFGLVGLVKLPVDLMPSFEFPMVSVVTYYLGAGSEDIETNVTETIEDALATISGVEHIDSVSQNNLSVVSVQFAFGTDLAEAASDIREQLDGLAMDLPKDIEPPVLVKMSSANIPILVMGATATENYKGLRHIMIDSHEWQPFSARERAGPKGAEVMRKLMALTVAVLAVAAVVCGCGKTADKVVLRITDNEGKLEPRTVTAGYVNERLDRMMPPYIPNIPGDEGKKQLLEDVIRKELLVIQALRAGLDKDPEQEQARVFYEGQKA